VGDPFCDGDRFDSASVPSSIAYNDLPSGVEVRNISGCGSQQILADLIVGVDPFVDVDLCMRDCGTDVCTEPSPCDKFWASPDVYIDNNVDGIIDPPADGLENRLFARVRNVGATRASNVHVDFYYTDPTMGIDFPSDGSLFGSYNIPLIGPGGSEVAGVLWSIPLPPPSPSLCCARAT
jgi:hypothetical protein